MITPLKVENEVDSNPNLEYLPKCNNYRDIARKEKKRS